MSGIVKSYTEFLCLHLIYGIPSQLHTTNFEMSHYLTPLDIQILNELNLRYQDRIFLDVSLNFLMKRKNLNRRTFKYL